MAQDDNASNVDEALVYANAVFKEKFGAAVAVTHLPQSRNFLFKMTAADRKQYVVKIYSQRRGLIANCERIAYDKMQDQISVRQCFAMEDRAEHRPYAILEYVAGTTLLDSVALLQDNPALETRIVHQIADFIAACATTSLSGFGEIAPDFSGKFTTWADFLTDFLARLAHTIGALPAGELSALMLHRFGHLTAFLHAERDFLASRAAAFVPIDLNMANFLLTAEQRVVALDLESFWAADPLFALGEWAGHTFGTSRFDAFLAAYRPLAPQEMACVRFYALMSNLDVLSFIIKYQFGDPLHITPWGNPNRFIDLIAEHGDWLDARYG
jgi:Ser/Thr protein kinase RdoA (MazF antagonist)